MVELKVVIPRIRFGEFAMEFADCIECVFSVSSQENKLMRVTLQVHVSNMTEVQKKLSLFV